MSVRVHFAVDVGPLDQGGEAVFVCGSTPSLGEWNPKRALVLHPDQDDPSRWRGYVDEDAEQIKYRYYVGYRLYNGNNEERAVVAQWESHLQPRSILLRAEQRGGSCREHHVDIFEYYAGRRCSSEGWLQFDDENQIVLRFHGKALKFYKSERKNCRIKVTPLDVRHVQPSAPSAPPGMSVEEYEADEDDEGDTVHLPSHSKTLVSTLTSTNCTFQIQSPNGITFNNHKDYLIFKTRSVAVDYLAFLLEIFNEDGKRIGACYALPSSLPDTFGQTTLPFINLSGRPIGQITVEYLFVRNLRLPIPPLLMDISYAHHWKKRTTIEVGHRGSGNSYTKFAMTRENTIRSLNTAAKNGADYVEFDVQLTKDKIAVIYHDFHVLVSVAKRTELASDQTTPPQDFHEMAVKDLKLSQLQLLKMEHLEHDRKENVKKLIGEVDEEEDLKPFPTLVEALRKVDPDVGFNVEVKYPMMQEDGFHECDHYFERNAFVDIILSDLLTNAGDRRIMFSSFDPDICSLIAMKQNRYPVLFLCVGETQRYARFQDQRSSTSLAAVNFAASAELLGVNFNSEDLLRDPRPVRRATELALVSFVWGEDLDKKEHVSYFKKELGVDGIIYDRIGEEERRTNVFVVEREAKRALFLVTSGSSTPVRNPSPERKDIQSDTITEEDNTQEEPSFQLVDCLSSMHRPVELTQS